MTERVFGFESMPAPFVVVHLQVAFTTHEFDASLADTGDERPGVFPRQRVHRLGAANDQAAFLAN